MKTNLPASDLHTATNRTLLATKLGLDDRGIGIRFQAWKRNFSLLHSFHIGSGAHLASYPMETRWFPQGKGVGGDHVNSHLVPKLKMGELYLHSTIRLTVWSLIK
jgi:hypothetical protein